MSTYTGLYYGIYLNAKNLTSKEDIQGYYNGEKTSVLKIIEKATGFDTNSLDEMNGIFIAKAVKEDGYDCHYSGLVERVNINPLLEFNANLPAIEQELNEKIIIMNEILEKNGYKPITPPKSFYYFSHTVT